MNKIFLLLLTLIFSVNVQAATYYVSPTGSDTTGAGTNGNPWLTLQKCIDVPLVAGVTACESNGSAICTGRGPTNWSDGDNILNSNPLFTDIITRVYTPTGSSPSLNVGINYAGRTVDADGISMSGTQDIGAYEYYTVNAPTLPSAVDTPADNGGQINIAWTVSTSVTVTAQKVYQGATPGGPYQLISTINNNTTATHTATQLANGTTYYFAITATDGQHTSANSTEVNAVPSSQINPVDPTTRGKGTRPKATRTYPARGQVVRP